MDIIEAIKVLKKGGKIKPKSFSNDDYLYWKLDACEDYDAICIKHREGKNEIWHGLGHCMNEEFEIYTDIE